MVQIIARKSNIIDYAHILYTLTQLPTLWLTAVSLLEHAATIHKARFYLLAH